MDDLLNSCILNEYQINFVPFKNIVRLRVYKLFLTQVFIYFLHLVQNA